jgi:hypothetical protein
MERDRLILLIGGLIVFALLFWWLVLGGSLR